jgi:acetoacetyl-CoA synthetase
VSEAFPPDIHLASISGGTDLCGCFVLGDPTSPVYAGEIQRPGLGMAVDVVDDHGRPAPLDERGELVCTQAFPSMPLGFWGDADGSRYRAAYFDKHPGIWSHGDFASWTTHGGMIVHGRSDTTLNPGGVRIGTAEIYRRVEVIDDVIEALVFGQQWDDDVRVVLAVRLRDGAPLDAPLVEQIRRVIRTGCTPRHVPAVIVAVRDLPRTRSGKLAELAVTDAVNGRPVRNTSALANPDAIDEIVAAVADWSAAHEPDRG